MVLVDWNWLILGARENTGLTGMLVAVKEIAQRKYFSPNHGCKSRNLQIPFIGELWGNWLMFYSLELCM